MIQLKHSSLYAIPTRIDAYDFRKYGTTLQWYKTTGAIMCDPLDVGFDFEIMGTVTEAEIGFDPEPFVKKNTYGHNGYRDYVESTKTTQFNWCNPEQSFRSLLTISGILFNNPLCKKEPNLIGGIDTQKRYDSIDRCLAWQEMEYKVVSKVVIIKQLK